MPAKEMHSPRLTDYQLQAALEGLPGWLVLDGKLHREYRFKDFVHAFGFMATSAIAVEALNHHPEWSNVYNRVTVDLWTHEEGGITQKDIDLAALLEGIAQKLLG